MDISWLDKSGISTKTGIGYTGSEDKYLSALQRYYRGFAANSQAVRECLNAADIENYCIKVHSLKSNSRMIGALALADAFEELEMASRNGDMALMNSKTGTVLDMYAEVISIIRPIGEMEAIRVSGEITEDEARETADRLLEALDDFDDELSAELADKLMGYPFRMTQKAALREAISDISDFMYDEAAELIRSIIPAIE